MHEHQQNRRTAAKRAFTESLEQLQQMLSQNTQPIESEAPQNTNAHNGSDTKAWEDAEADLEQFFGDVQPEEAVDEEN